MSNSKAIERFSEKVNRIDDNNFGDYSRKLQTYINGLKKDLSSPSHELAREVLKLQTTTSFSEKEDLDLLIIQANESVKKLKSLS